MVGDGIVASQYRIGMQKNTNTNKNMPNIKEQNLNDLRAELLQFKETIEQALALLSQGNMEEAQKVASRGLAAVPLKSLVISPGGHTEPTKIPDGSRVIEGVFDGQHMIGADGRQYLVPPNYASKSKLVEGDMLKLAITPEGAFVYKQISPQARHRLTTTLEQDSSGFWTATDGVHRWRLLTAAVSFFKGKSGDEVIILTPSGAPSKWAAVENIIAR